MTFRAQAKLSLAAATLALVATLAPAQAQESSCQADFQRLSTKRAGLLQRLNAIGKAGKGKMDPLAACPVARALVAAEAEMLAYMVKNKEWCSVPDAFIDQIKGFHAKSSTFASQACSVAAKVKQMQEQQRAQAQAGPAAQPLRLPAGPL